MFTMGMRGDGDEPLSGASVGLVESEFAPSWCVWHCDLTLDITAAQLGILDHVYGKENVAAIPKMWAMYKEVADYYLEGVSHGD